MLKAAKYFLILFAAFFIFTTCKKYPEDDFISLKTSKMRLEGEWQLEKIEINDENVGYKYNDSLTALSFKDFKFWFKFERILQTSINYKKQTMDLLMINKSSKKEADALNGPDVSGFDFGLDPKLKKLYIPGESTKKRFPIKDEVAHKIFTNLFASAWNVQTLYNKIFIIETTKNNIKHRLSFKKIRNK